MNLKLTGKKNNFLVLDVSIDDDSSLDIELGVLKKRWKRLLGSLILPSPSWRYDEKNSQYVSVNVKS